MAIKACIASQEWIPVYGSREMWEYGGKFYCLGVYNNPDNTELGAIGMFRTIGTYKGEPNMENGGTTWEEVDIAGAPRNSWSMASGQNPNDLAAINADRFGDVVYFACECDAFGDKRIQVGSFNLATATWGAQGTDDVTNPVVSSPDGLKVTDMKVFAADEYLISYVIYGPGGVNTSDITLVQYNTGTWGTPLTVYAGDPAFDTFVYTYPRLAHEQGSDYAHVIWAQENGNSGNPPPEDAIVMLRACTYTISAGTVGSITDLDTYSQAQHNTGAGIAAENLSYCHNFDGDTFMQYYWVSSPGTFEQNYAKATPTDSATPTWTTGSLETIMYQYDNNARFVTTAGGELLFIHAIGEDTTETPPLDNIDPQIAYKVWDGSAWGANNTFYVYATGFDWLSRTTNDLPVPDSGVAETYGGDFDIHVIGTFTGDDNDWTLSPIASSAGGAAGFVCLAQAGYERLADAEALALYFFREPSNAPATTSNNVMFFGL
jgi:hypothetical protein